MENERAVAPDCLWWERTYGPMTIIEKISNACRAGVTCLIVKVDSNMAFRHEFRQAASRSLYGINNNIDTVELDCQDILDNGKRISEAMIESLLYGDECILKRGDTELDHADKNGWLKDRLFWLKGVGTPETEKAAFDFAAEFCNKHGKSGGFVLIETPFEPSKSVKNAVYINSEEIITESDMETFATLYYRFTHGEKCDYITNRYVGFIAACVCGTDAELAVALIDKTDFYADNIIGILEDISSDGSVHACRGNDAGSGREPHTLYLLKNGRRSEVERKVWKAQLQTFFPLLEEKRLEYVDKYKRELSSIITNNVVLDNFTGKSITDTVELEIGPLFYCMKKDRPAFVRDDFDDVEFMAEIRNLLAHLEMLSAAQVSRLAGILNRPAAH